MSQDPLFDSLIQSRFPGLMGPEVRKLNAEERAPYRPKQDQARVRRVVGYHTQGPPAESARMAAMYKPEEIDRLTLEWALQQFPDLSEEEQFERFTEYKNRITREQKRQLEGGTRYIAGATQAVEEALMAGGARENLPMSYMDLLEQSRGKRLAAKPGPDQQIFDQQMQAAISNDPGTGKEVKINWDPAQDLMYQSRGRQAFRGKTGFTKIMDALTATGRGMQAARGSWEAQLQKEIGLLDLETKPEGAQTWLGMPVQDVWALPISDSLKIAVEAAKAGFQGFKDPAASSNDLDVVLQNTREHFLKEALRRVEADPNLNDVFMEKALQVMPASAMHGSTKFSQDQIDKIQYEAYLGFKRDAVLEELDVLLEDDIGSWAIKYPGMARLAHEVIVDPLHLVNPAAIVTTATKVAKIPQAAAKLKKGVMATEGAADAAKILMKVPNELRYAPELSPLTSVEAKVGSMPETLEMAGDMGRMVESDVRTTMKYQDPGVVEQANEAAWALSGIEQKVGKLDLETATKKYDEALAAVEKKKAAVLKADARKAKQAHRELRRAEAKLAKEHDRLESLALTEQQRRGTVLKRTAKEAERADTDVRKAKLRLAREQEKAGLLEAGVDAKKSATLKKAAKEMTKADRKRRVLEARIARVSAHIDEGGQAIPVEAGAARQRLAEIKGDGEQIVEMLVDANLDAEAHIVNRMLQSSDEIKTAEKFIEKLPADMQEPFIDAIMMAEEAALLRASLKGKADPLKLVRYRGKLEKKLDELTPLEGTPTPIDKTKRAYTERVKAGAESTKDWTAAEGKYLQQLMKVDEAQAQLMAAERRYGKAKRGFADVRKGAEARLEAGATSGKDWSGAAAARQFQAGKVTAAEQKVSEARTAFTKSRQSFEGRRRAVEERLAAGKPSSKDWSSAEAKRIAAAARLELVKKKQPRYAQLEKLVKRLEDQTGTRFKLIAERQPVTGPEWAARVKALTSAKSVTKRKFFAAADDLGLVNKIEDLDPIAIQAQKDLLKAETGIEWGVIGAKPGTKKDIGKYVLTGDLESGYLIPKAYLDFNKALGAPVVDPGALRDIIRTTMYTWRWLKTVPNPMFAQRNFGSAFWLDMNAHGLKTLDLERQAQVMGAAWQAATGTKSPFKTFRLADGTTIPTEEFIRIAEHAGQVDGLDWQLATDLMTGKLSKKVAEGLDWVGRKMGVPGTNLDAATASRASENFQKLVIFGGFLEGTSKQQIAKAAQLASEYASNYQRMGRAERLILRDWIPFYGWMKFATTRAIKSMGTHPGRVAFGQKLREHFQRDFALPLNGAEVSEAFRDLGMPSPEQPPGGKVTLYEARDRFLIDGKLPEPGSEQYTVMMIDDVANMGLYFIPMAEKMFSAEAIQEYDYRYLLGPLVEVMVGQVNTKGMNLGDRAKQAGKSFFSRQAALIENISELFREAGRGDKAREIKLRARLYQHLGVSGWFVEQFLPEENYIGIPMLPGLTSSYVEDAQRIREDRSSRPVEDMYDRMEYLKQNPKDIEYKEKPQE